MENIILTISTKEIIKRIAGICQVILVIALIYFLLTGFQREIELMCIFMAIGTVPSILLLMEYLRYTTKFEKVVFTSEDIQITYKDSVVKQIPYSDIKVIKLYKSASKDKNSFTIFINEDYYFAVIITKEKSKIPLTSLFGPALDDALEMMKDIPFVREKTGFAYIFKMND